MWWKCRACLLGSTTSPDETTSGTLDRPKNSKKVPSWRVFHFSPAASCRNSVFWRWKGEILRCDVMPSMPLAEMASKCCETILVSIYVRMLIRINHYILYHHISSICVEKIYKHQIHLAFWVPQRIYNPSKPLQKNQKTTTPAKMPPKTFLSWPPPSRQFWRFSLGWSIRWSLKWWNLMLPRVQPSPPSKPYATSGVPSDGWWTPDRSSERWWLPS